MAGHRWFPSVAAALLASVLVAGCVTDRSDEVAIDPCGAAAGLTEELASTGGLPSDGLRAHLDDLDAAPVGDGFGAAPQQVRDQIDAGDPSDPDGRVAWEAALTELDTEVQARCGFSMRTVVAGTASDEDRGPEPDSADELPDLDVDALDWGEILTRVGDQPWVDAGYEAAVGEGPGTFVVVFGVESADVATTVCDDVAAALADTGAVGEAARVEVHGLGGHLLAQSVDGACPT